VASSTKTSDEDDVDVVLVLVREMNVPLLVKLSRVVTR
jgi:hypothetical protein